MDPKIIAALIVAAGFVMAAGIFVYFSPYQTCLRNSPDIRGAAIYCTGRPSN